MEHHSNVHAWATRVSRSLYSRFIVLETNLVYETWISYSLKEVAELSRVCRYELVRICYCLIALFIEMYRNRSISIIK